MQMLSIFWSMISWIFRGVVVKFVVLTAVFGVMTVIIPKGIALISPMIGTGGLTSAFSGLGGGVWWVLDAFALDFGIPLMLSAYVARFLIRRLPVIG